MRCNERAAFAFVSRRVAEGIMCLFISPLYNQPTESFFFLLLLFTYTMSATCNSSFLFSNKDSSSLRSIVQWSALGVRQVFYDITKEAVASIQQKQKMKKTTKKSRRCSWCALILSAFPKTGLCVCQCRCSHVLLVHLCSIVVRIWWSINSQIKLDKVFEAQSYFLKVYWWMEKLYRNLGWPRIIKVKMNILVRRQQTHILPMLNLQRWTAIYKCVYQAVPQNEPTVEWSSCSHGLLVWQKMNSIFYHVDKNHKSITTLMTAGLWNLCLSSFIWLSTVRALPKGHCSAVIFIVSFPLAPNRYAARKKTPTHLQYFSTSIAFFVRWWPAQLQALTFV